MGQGLFEEIKGHLEERGAMLKQRSIVDATVITAPSPTKTKQNRRDPETRQMKKSRQYHFGMKLHIGVDADSGLVNSMATTSANVHDVTQANRVLHGEERAIWGDVGYIGVDWREENRGNAAAWYVAMRAGQRRKLEPGSAGAITENVKSSIRARVGHTLSDVKGVFGYAKLSYRCQAKNTERLLLLVALSNLRRAQRTMAC